MTDVGNLEEGERENGNLISGRTEERCGEHLLLLPNIPSAFDLQ